MPDRISLAHDVLARYEKMIPTPYDQLVRESTALAIEVLAQAAEVARLRKLWDELALAIYHEGAEPERCIELCRRVDHLFRRVK